MLGFSGVTTTLSGTTITSLNVLIVNLIDYVCITITKVVLSFYTVSRMLYTCNMQDKLPFIL